MKRAQIYFLISIFCLSTSLLKAENELPALSAELKKSDLKTKYDAIEKIKAIRTLEASQVLLNAMKREKDVTVRLTMLDEINAMGFAATVPELAPFLKDKSPQIRQRVVRVISRMGGTAAEDALLVAWKTERDNDVRSAIVQGLNLCGSQKSVDALSAAVSDDSPAVRANAQQARKRITGNEVK